ncbi:hypothetical protein [Fulvivirga sediminis]|uniref:Uncharacterized protein n=1 Tax=Fulvivirga sediminis TaxID=2803949 RepID=A0A937FDM0_9BACT|nr:hypothetical protein [Fulvivirga sediminis]MBL3658603.1 hypothetical protein [Fulvivirga sediminis]
MLGGEEKHNCLIFRIAEELQYLDLLTQKVEHIRQIHSRIDLESPVLIDEHCAGKDWSVFGLSKLQVEVAVMSLIQKLKSINRMLEKINPSFTIRQEFIELVTMYSKNLTENLDIICDHCHKYQFLNIQEERDMLYKLYSTVSERLVLDMYLDNSAVTTEEIVASLKNGIDKASTPDFF